MKAPSRYLWLVALCLACSGEATSDRDSGGAPACEDDAQCDDGLFCNGDERCAAGRCAPGTAPCDAESCDESTDGCDASCETDADGDGALALACGGDDCDDDDPARFPGNTEICDDADVDEDCDPSTFGTRDGDRDGWIDAACCNDGPGGLACGDDCADADARAHPTAPEVCNGIDDDCNGRLDGPDEDVDGDGYASPDCTAVGADCDDSDPEVHPGGVERCDGKDGDCDGVEDHPLATPCVTCSISPAVPPLACEGATPVCCGTGTTTSCGAEGECAPVCSTTPDALRAVAECDGRSDCPSGQVCCLSVPCGVTSGLLARCEDSCASDRVACHDDADCAAGMRCAPRNLPSDILRRCVAP